MKNKVSIIIVTNSQKTLLSQCLAHLEATTNKFKDKEIIIVDNASPHADFIKQLCNQHKCRYIKSEENLSFSYANDLAIKKSKGKYLLLLNDDTIPNQDGWLEKFIDFAESKPNAAVVGCKLIFPQDKTVQHCGVVFNQRRQPFHKLIRTETHDPRTLEAQQFQAVTFACVLIKRNVYDKLGGFSHIDKKPAYHYEDIDFCFKARESGYEVWYTPDVQVMHFSASSFKGLNMNNQETFKHLAKFISKWWIKIEHDDWKTWDMPPHNPHVMIGLPLGDGCRWRFKQLMNMIDGIEYWKKNISIAFGIDNCSQDFHEEIMTWAKLNKEKYREVLIPKNLTYTEGKVKSVIRNRNNIRDISLQKNADYTFFIDADVIIEKNTLRRLINICEHKGADISAGAYFYKTEPLHKPMIFSTTMPTKRFKEENFQSQLDISSFKENKIIGLGNFKIAKELMDGEIHEAGACHMGCTLIKRKCLEAIPYKYTDCYGTEDLAWFAEAEEKGFKLMIDTGMKLFHLDANGYVYCWWNMDLKDDEYTYKLKPVKEKINV